MQNLKPSRSGVLHRAGEDYLETVLMLHKRKGMVRSVDVAREMNFSKPSVSKAVSVLQQAGYLAVDNEHFLHLTEEGLKIAERVYERHTFLTEFLIAIGVDPETAESDACMMEHDISPKTFECLKEMRRKIQF